MYLQVEIIVIGTAGWRRCLCLSCLVEDGKPATMGPGHEYFCHEQPNKPASAAPKTEGQAVSSHLQHNKLYQMTIETCYQLMCGSRSGNVAVLAGRAHPWNPERNQLPQHGPNPSCLCNAGHDSQYGPAEAPRCRVDGVIVQGKRKAQYEAYQYLQTENKTSISNASVHAQKGVVHCAWKVQLSKAPDNLRRSQRLVPAV